MKEKLQKALREKWESHFSQEYFYPFSKWHDYLGSIGIRHPFLEPANCKDTIVIPDPAMPNVQLEMPRQTAEKILVIGLP